MLNLSKSGGDQTSGGAPSERSNQNSPEPSVHEEDENISEANISDTEEPNEKEEGERTAERQETRKVNDHLALLRSPSCFPPSLNACHYHVCRFPFSYDCTFLTVSRFHFSHLTQTTDDDDDDDAQTSATASGTFRHLFRRQFRSHRTWKVASKR